MRNKKFCNYVVVTYTRIMKASVIKIGNSKGLRLNRMVLEKYHIKNEVEMILQDDCIILKPIVEEPRKGWEKAFKTMHENGDDKLFIDDVFDDENWD